MKIKKIVLIAISAWVILLFAFLSLGSLSNDYTAKQTAKELRDLPLPEQTEWAETVWKAGKLVGNGYGMQYFGAILIKSELSLEQLQAYYAAFAKEERRCLVEKQEGKEIRATENISLSFETDASDGKYYIVYSWGSSNAPFRNFDLRGH